VREIIKEMRNKMPKAFFGFNVFLSALMTILSYYLGTTVETVLFLSLGEMGQIVKISLK
jgi:hypothetical protein